VIISVSKEIIKMQSGSVSLPISMPDSQQGQHKKVPNIFERFLRVLSSGKFIVYRSCQTTWHTIVSFSLFLIEHIALLLRIIPKRFYPNLLYPIEEEIVSTTTRVIFTRRKQNRRQVCLKLWQFENSCNPDLVTRKVTYLLEGLEFNRRVAPFVYFGIAPIYLNGYEDSKKILRGKLMEDPKERHFEYGMDYALVMRRLDESLKLNNLIYQQKLCDLGDFEFLAKEVAHMHKKLDNSPIDKGTPHSIQSKLVINCRLFEESLHQLIKESQRLCIPDEACSFIDKYLWIKTIITKAYAECSGLFQQRYVSQCIKRCHGDLKTTNLWIEPAKSYFFGLKKRPQHLIALDCVDFNPEFCHIDTLSDLAMLTIDLELHLYNWLNKGSNRQSERDLTQHFLNCYLHEMHEDRDKSDLLLEYYMTEKSMVCAYVSILYDERFVIGKKYLEVASSHAQKLEKMLTHSDTTTQTPSLLVSP
jgi:aminoglycoside phosphotransferase family enzyme